MMDRRQAALVFIFFSVFYVLTNSFRSYFQIPDEEYVLLVTSQLVAGQSLELPEDVPKSFGANDVGSDGKIYSAFQIGQSLVYAPFFLITKLLLRFSDPYSSRVHGNVDAYEFSLERNTRKFLYICTSIFSAWTCSILFLFATKVGYSRFVSLLLTVMMGLGTMIWPYSKYLFTEALQAPLMLSTVYLLFAQKKEGRLIPRTMMAAGAAFGFLLSIRVIFAVCLPLWAAYWFYQNKDRRLIAPIIFFCIPLGIFLIPQLLYDYIRFGNILSMGYGKAGFTTPLYVGLFGYLLSPGKSFFLYAPITLLFFFGFRRFYARAKAEALLFCAILLLVPLKYASWWVWSGDPSWGPRYLLVLTPFFMIPVGEVLEKALKDSTWWKRGVLAALFVLSMTIQGLAVSVHYLHYYGHVKNGSTSAFRDPHLATEFIPEFSPLVGQWWITKSLLSGDKNLPAPWMRTSNSVNVPALDVAKWDFWIVDLFKDHTPFRKRMKPLFGAVILFLLLTIVGQELFRSIRNHS